MPSGSCCFVYLALSWLVLRLKDGAKEWSTRRWLTTHIAMGLAYLPWLPAAAGQASRIQSGFWIPEPDALFFTHYLARYTGHFLLAWIGSGILLALLVVLGRRFNAKVHGPVLFALGWLVFMLGVPFLVSKLSQPMMHAKSAISVLVAIALIVAIGFDELSRRLAGQRERGVALGLIAAWTVASVVAITFKTYLPQNREAWREMTHYVGDAWHEGDLAVLYHPDFDYFYCYDYYLPEQVEAYHLLCQGEACQAPVEEIEARAAQLGSARLFLLKVRASNDFPEPLGENWVVEESISFINGTLDILAPRNK